MSISSRGHNNTLVLDSCAVPVTEMFESLINFRDIKEITRRYPVSADEIFECADACLDISPLTEDDFIDFECLPLERGDPEEDDEFNLNTVKISDHMYISVITHARTFFPEVDDIDKLYTDGLYLILAECVMDLSQGNEYFKSSELHSIVFEGFQKAFPHDVMEAIEKLAKTFNVDKKQDTHDNH